MLVPQFVKNGTCNKGLSGLIWHVLKNSQILIYNLIRNFRHWSEIKRVTSVLKNNGCLFLEYYEIHKYNLWQNSFFM
jgi:hypothetical protein